MERSPRRPGDCSVALAPELPCHCGEASKCAREARASPEVAAVVVLNGYITATRGTCCRSLLILRELRFSFARFDPGAHLPQFRCLVVYHRSQSLHFRSQLSNRRFLLLNLAILFLASAMLFEKLVEQHSVDRLIAEALDLPLPRG